MNRCLPLLLSCVAFCIPVATGTSIQAPRAGTVRYLNGSVYPLLGLSRSLVVGRPFSNDVSAAAFADQIGIVAIATGLDILDLSGKVTAHLATDSTGAVLAVTDVPSGAMAWLPASGSIVTFAAGTWRTTSVVGSPPGPVLAISRASKDTAHLLVGESGQVFEITVGFASGNILLQRLLSDVKLPATYLGDGLLFQDGDSLVYQSAAIGKKSIRFSEHIDTFEQMSAEAVHGASNGSATHWMLELTHSDDLSVSQLPVPVVSLAGGVR